MKKLSKSFTTGAVALVFCVLGYQSALLVHYASVTKIVADRDRPDTVYINVPGNAAGHGDGYPIVGIDGALDRNCRTTPSTTGNAPIRKNSVHHQAAIRIRENVAPSRAERFVFNPNTATVEELVRLGFTARQARSIDNYRTKGGRFRRKSDFAKSYVVSDEMFRSLEPFIEIPRIDLNDADSAVFDSLPGIGGYFAGRMVEWRRRLRGYSSTEQLLDIRGFDSTRLAALYDLVTISHPAEYPLWDLPEDSLRIHPYIGRSARGIVLFRDNNPVTDWTLDALHKAGVLDDEQTEKLSGCRIRDAVRNTDGLTE